jgi:hypothetical protein
MGFDLQRLTLSQRAIAPAPHDDKIKAACAVCDYVDLCGGFWVWDDSRWCDEDCADCPAFCCHRKHWFSDARRLGGLSFDDIHWKPWEIEWPDIVWSIGGRVGNLSESVYIIPVDSLMDRFTLRWAKTRDLRSRFSIPEDSKIGISFCFRDWLLSNFRDHEDIVADALERFDVDFVLPINYSIYRNFPRLDQLLAMRRRMLSLKMFQDRGLNVIPDMGAIRDIDVNRWGDWVLRENCNTVFMTVQTVKGKMQKAEYKIKFGVLQKLREKIGPNVRFLIQGVSARRMPLFISELGKVSFVNSAAWVKAELRINAVTGEGVRYKGLSVQETFALNVRLLKRILCETRSNSVSSNGG